jgi:hypothetical protein
MKETRLRYVIRIQGHLAARRLRHFEGLTVQPDDEGQTTITGSFRDQSTLFGVLNWLQSLNVPLLSVQQLEATNAFEEREEK